MFGSGSFRPWSVVARPVIKEEKEEEVKSLPCGDNPNLEQIVDEVIKRAGKPKWDTDAFTDNGSVVDAILELRDQPVFGHLLSIIHLARCRRDALGGGDITADMAEAKAERVKLQSDLSVLINSIDDTIARTADLSGKVIDKLDARRDT